MDNDSISDGDLRLCHIYGAQSREFHAPHSWDDCVERLQHGWLRIRGDCRLAWTDAEPHVRAAWHHAVAGMSEVRDALLRQTPRATAVHSAATGASELVQPDRAAIQGAGDE